MTNLAHLQKVKKGIYPGWKNDKRGKRKRIWRSSGLKRPASASTRANQRE